MTDEPSGTQGGETTGQPAPADAEMAELYKQMEAEVAAAQSVKAHPVEAPALEPAPAAAEPDQRAKDINLTMILDIPVEVHVELGQTTISIRDILRLGPGSIVELDRLAGGSADIIVNGKLVGQGDVVVVNENFGVRITKLVEPQQRLESI